MPREPFDFKKFAADRSTRNSQMSNELGKAAAQAVMLINGGAAAAILSFIKGTAVNKVFFALGLTGYGAGVVCAAWMMYALNQILYGRSEYWQSYFNPEKLGEPYRSTWKERADKWGDRKDRAFPCSVAFFFFNSKLLHGRRDIWLVSKRPSAAPLAPARAYSSLAPTCHTARWSVRSHPSAARTTSA
jgi:hypothetical protein